MLSLLVYQDIGKYFVEILIGQAKLSGNETIDFQGRALQIEIDTLGRHFQRKVSLTNLPTTKH